MIQLQKWARIFDAGAATALLFLGRNFARESRFQATRAASAFTFSWPRGRFTSPLREIWTQMFSRLPHRERAISANGDGPRKTAMQIDPPPEIGDATARRWRHRRLDKSPRGRKTARSVRAGLVPGLVPAIHAAPFPADRKRSGGLTTSPNALAFGWMTGTSPVMTVSAVVIVVPIGAGALPRPPLLDAGHLPAHIAPPPVRPNRQESAF
jgi:hypothetical protein